jgi:Ran GTPase-activating protein (RanGAP) involved in mRNA processing and transport
LSENDSLAALNLSDNAIGSPEAGDRLAAMLQTNRTLQHVDLSNNYQYNVYDHGADYTARIAAALSLNCSISRLTFDGGSNGSRGESQRMSHNG